MNPLPRLIAYARPYRGRFIAALAAMIIYAAANAGIVAQIKPLMNYVLNGRMAFSLFASIIIVGYIIKGIGAYSSTY